jgi:hypothetical protein
MALAKAWLPGCMRVLCDGDPSIESRGVIGEMRIATPARMDGATDRRSLPAFDSPGVFASIPACSLPKDRRRAPPGLPQPQFAIPALTPFTRIRVWVLGGSGTPHDGGFSRGRREATGRTGRSRRSTEWAGGLISPGEPPAPGRISRVARCASATEPPASSGWSSGENRRMQCTCTRGARVISLRPVEGGCGIGWALARPSLAGESGGAPAFLSAKVQRWVAVNGSRKARPSDRFCAGAAEQFTDPR